MCRLKALTSDPWHLHKELDVAACTHKPTPGKGRVSWVPGALWSASLPSQ